MAPLPVLETKTIYGPKRAIKFAQIASKPLETEQIPSNHSNSSGKRPTTRTRIQKSSRALTPSGGRGRFSLKPLQIHHEVVAVNRSHGLMSTQKSKLEKS